MSDGVKRLRDTLRMMREELMRGDFSTGYCCCGSPIKDHSYHDGHSPVDDGEYHLQGVIDRIDETLSLTDPA